VIAGSLKGRRLQPPADRRIRPTSDKLRETLFNILAGEVVGARVLDGFAGTGAVGIEAISRGAAEVTFVEQTRHGADLIAKNLERCGIRDGYTMIRATMDAAIERLSGHRFDLVLLDPPYEHAHVGDLLRRVGALLADAGRLVVEHARRDAMPATTGRLVRSRLVTSGDSALAFYEVGAGTVPDVSSEAERGGDGDP
jgi:16S rRNA (guanine(966)-N(2))-methyltransferase RsmD